MDNQRLLVWAFFGLMAFWTYEAWMRDYGPAPPPPSAASPATPAAGTATQDGLPELTDAGTDAPALAVTDANEEIPASAAAPAIRVTTDVLELTISLQGGTIEGAALLQYPVAKDRPDELVQLLSKVPDSLGLLQTGLRSAGGGDEPTHRALFTADQTSYTLGGADELVVPLHWTDGAGLVVEKRFRFKRGEYAFVIEQAVDNTADAEWRGAEYVQIERRSFPHERSMFDVDSYSFDGPIVYNGDKAEKLQRDDLLEDGPVDFATDSGWFGSIQHHFVTAVVPQPGTTQRYRVAVRENVATSSSIGAPRTVSVGSTETFASTVFIGPKLQAQLRDVTPTLRLTVDYGILTILSQPLFWLLSHAHTLFSNWGAAIIAVTILIKLVFYKLTEASGRSMAKMRNLQPRIKALQERYKDDRQQLSQAMMDLYKREKVNPAAGCLPILIQMPFFLAFYWVLLESVEMRQAPFALWITDLSSRDPFFILPLIMGVAMFAQQKLNPQVGDPVQVKVMQIMPVIFTGFFAFFPSGLVLYWVTNTLLSIAQQWKINKVVEQEAKGQKAGKKPRSGDG